MYSWPLSRDRDAIATAAQDARNFIINSRILKLHIENSATRLVLASASPRRAELLRAAGIAFDAQPAHVDESVHAGETPTAYVRRVAEDKARAVHQQRPDLIVLAADTTVVVDHHILGKPEDDADARRMLRLLSGRSHQVITGVTVAGPGGAAVETRVETTTVEFARLSTEDIDWYVASGEPMDKAGAYAIQGLASRFIPRIDGSYSNVVGLPVALVFEMLKRFMR
jgi:septum formation protein